MLVICVNACKCWNTQKFKNVRMDGECGAGGSGAISVAALQAGRAAGLDVSSATSDRRSSELTSSENTQELRGELGAVALAGETTEPAIYIFLSVLL